MLDFLRHCRRFSFHERDFRPSLLCLRKSSLFVSSLLSFPNQMFPSFLSVGSQLLHYTLQGEFFTHPPRFGASILCFISVFQTWLRRLDSCPCWGSRRGLAGTGWRGSVGLWSPSRAPGGGAVPGRHDYSCSRSAGSAGRCASISFTSKLTRFWLPPWRLWQRCLRLQPPQLL